MEKSVLDFIVEKTNELLAVPYCCEEAKTAAQAWLAAIGTENEASKTAAYIKELEEDIEPIDGLIAFAGSDAGASVCGAQEAEKMLKHALEIRAEGAKYCDCPACASCEAIISKKEYTL